MADTEETPHPVVVWFGRLITAGVAVWALILVASAWARSHPSGVPSPMIRHLESSSAMVLASLAVALLAATAVHELGHVAIALSMGHRISEVTVGPWGWVRHDGRLRFVWRRPWEGRVCAELQKPISPENALWRDALGIAGGPAASLLFLLLVVFLYRSRPDGPMSAPTETAWGLLGLIGAVSAFVFVSGLVPSPGSDTALLLGMLRRRREALRDQAVRALHRLASARTPCDEWPEQWVEAAAAGPDGGEMGSLGCYLAHQWAYRVGDTERAVAYLDRLLAVGKALDGWQEPGIWLEPAFFLACYQRDASRARRLYEKGKDGPTVPPVKRLRVEAAVLLAEGNLDACRQRANMALDALDGQRWPFDQHLKYEHDTLIWILVAAGEAGASGAAQEAPSRE